MRSTGEALPLRFAMSALVSLRGESAGRQPCAATGNPQDRTGIDGKRQPCRLVDESAIETDIGQNQIIDMEQKPKRVAEGVPPVSLDAPRPPLCTKTSRCHCSGERPDRR